MPDICNAWSKALSIEPASPGGTRLELYRHPVLLWNDVVFALALAVFSTGLWIWILFQFELSGVLRQLVIVATACALLYGVVDTAEDVMLDRLLQDPRSISGGGASAACLLTRLKFVTIVGSVTGVVVFLTLSSVVAESKPSGSGRKPPAG